MKQSLPFISVHLNTRGLDAGCLKRGSMSSIRAGYRLLFSYLLLKRGPFVIKIIAAAREMVKVVAKANLQDNIIFFFLLFFLRRADGPETSFLKIVSISSMSFFSSREILRKASNSRTQMEQLVIWSMICSFFSPYPGKEKRAAISSDEGQVCV